MPTVGIKVTPSSAGATFTLLAQASRDGGSTWDAVALLADGPGATSAPATSVTAAGSWKWNPAGYSNFRLINTVAASAGSVSAVLVATAASELTRSVAVGEQADASAAWYSAPGSLLSRLSLLTATIVGAGSHTYGYTSGRLTTDTWTLFGTARTKTYGYDTNGLLVSESDWSPA
ncbi:hypothetical protein GTP44_13485 [Duganella sp. FT50W]|uniref:Uncharacterized protein n=1 Tax=Duganella lactea TaxID=2692173 RepID=A0A6L8MMA6_9BURK|nr:hypothetical protein [Duganella lactea]MYM82966.1 hypothetical protein [Duganella lactea]